MINQRVNVGSRQRSIQEGKLAKLASRASLVIQANITSDRPWAKCLRLVCIIRHKTPP